MRLLVLGPAYPFPVQDGTDIRVAHILRSLPNGCEAVLLCFGDVAEPTQEPLPAPCRGISITLPRPTRATGWKASPIAQVFRTDASMMWKFHSPLLAEQVRKYSQNVDGVLAIGLQMGPYLKEATAGLPTAIDNYNVESLILRRLAATRPGLKQLYWGWEAVKLEKAERQILESVGAVWAITDVDHEGMARIAPSAKIHTVPPGINTAFWGERSDQSAVSPPRFTFVGAFNWHVNEAAATWFHQGVWPRVREAVPGAELHLVGKSPSADMLALAQDPSVHVSGTVPDVRPYLWSSTASIVPLRYGSGVRNKILEAFAAGRPVVSTSVGCEGLPVNSGEHLLIADTEDEFAEACIRIAREPETADHLARAGRELVLEHERSAVRILQEAIVNAFGNGARTRK